MGVVRRVFAVLFLFSSLVSATTAPFMLERGFLSPNFFEGGKAGREVSGVFLNPAGYPHRTTRQIAVDASQNFLGYDRYSVAAIYPQGPFVFGLGYSQFSANDIAKVPLVSTVKATQTGSISDSYKLMVFTASTSPRPGLNVGVRAGQFEHQLSDDLGVGYIFDVGVRQSFASGLWAGMYTRYLAPMTVHWTKSATDESVPRQWVGELGYTAYPYSVAVSADTVYRRVYGEWSLQKRFSATSDAVWNDKMSLQRVSIGTVVDFGGFALSYLHLHYTQSELATDQDVVGLLFRLGD